MDCIFCKIVNGEIPSLKVYEDEYTMVFMDIAKDVDGHMVAIPKKHIKNILDCDVDTLSHAEGLNIVAVALIDALKQFRVFQVQVIVGLDFDQTGACLHGLPVCHAGFHTHSFCGIVCSQNNPVSLFRISAYRDSLIPQIRILNHLY